MTHGAGGFSSGGGGGGGGFSGGVSFSHHGGHHNSDGDSQLCKCFVVIGNIVTYLLCIRKNMSRYVRITLLWVYILAVVLSVSILLGVSWLGTNNFQSAPRDMRKVEKHINNAFCDGVTLSSSMKFTAYLFDTEPVVDPNSRQQFNTSYSMFISPNDYEYWGFYLLPGSRVRSYTTNDFPGLTVFVIMGEENLNAWTNSEGTCSDCYLFKGTVYTFLETRTTALKAANYYFVFYNQGVFVNNANANFAVNRTLYDVKGATDTCDYYPDRMPCTFDLPIERSSCVVFHSGLAFPHSSIDMTSTCKARWWMYMLVFAALPLLIGLLLSVLLWKICRDDRTSENSALTSVLDITPEDNYKRFD